MNQRFVWNFEINPAAQSFMPPPLNFPIDTKHWEARFFWPASSIIILQGLDASFLNLTHYDIKKQNDRYLILPNSDINLKIRKNNLVYKPIYERTPQCTAFGKKINLEGLAPADNLPGEHPIQVGSLMAQIKQQPNEISIKKEMLKTALSDNPAAKLELTRLIINHNVFFSLCIESKAPLLIDWWIKQLRIEGVSCDYVSFLKANQHHD